MSDYNYSTNPPPCSHCGFCCLATPCDFAIHAVGYQKHKPCPALEWEKIPESPVPVSRCGMLVHPESYMPAPLLARWQSLAFRDRMEIMDSGTGCSMKARVVTPDGVMEFALLSDEAKIAAANLSKANNVTVIHTK